MYTQTSCNTIDSLVSYAAESFNDNPALSRLGFYSTSYRELELLSRNVAVNLCLNGAIHGESVAILSDSCPEWGIAAVGVARAGLVIVPIDVNLSEEEIINIINKSKANYAFVSSKYENKLPKSIEKIAIEDVSSLNAELGMVDFDLPQSIATDTVFKLYNGESFDEISNESCVAETAKVAKEFSVKKDDIVLSLVPLSSGKEFVKSFLAPLFGGASINYMELCSVDSSTIPQIKKTCPNILMVVPRFLEKLYEDSISPILAKSHSKPTQKVRYEKEAKRKLVNSFGGKVRCIRLGGSSLKPEIAKFLTNIKGPMMIQ